MTSLIRYVLEERRARLQRLRAIGRSLRAGREDRLFHLWARHAAQEAEGRLRLTDIRLKEELEAISMHLDVQLEAERAENASLRSQLALRDAAAAAAAAQLHEQHESLHLEILTASERLKVQRQRARETAARTPVDETLDADLPRGRHGGHPEGAQDGADARTSSALAKPSPTASGGSHARPRRRSHACRPRPWWRRSWARRASGRRRRRCAHGRSATPMACRSRFTVCPRRAPRTAIAQAPVGAARQPTRMSRRGCGPRAPS